MSLQPIWQAVARQAAAIEGIKGAYATTEDTATVVHAWPEDVTDGPIALVDFAGSELLTTPPFEHMAYDFDIELWVPLGNANKSAAVASLAPMLERFLVAFRANTGLYGTCWLSQVLGSSGFDEEALNEKNHLVQSIVIRAQEARSVTPGIGPSS